MVLAALLALAQEVDPKKVDAAIDKGIKFLRRHLDGRRADADELILWTFVHSRVAEDDPDFQRLLKDIVASELTMTYRVALQAMVLESVDRVRYQEKIYRCGQFLVDNQTKEGGWGYGTETEYKDIKDEEGGERPSGTPYWASRPDVVRTITLKRQRWGDEEPDNSNSQYAMLGLLACHEAGIKLPADAIKKADEYWRATQQTAERTTTETGGMGTPEGWHYKDVKPPERPPQGGTLPQDAPKPKAPPAYGSMTAGGAGALIICDYLQKEKWGKDRDVKNAMAWLAANFSISKNPEADRAEVKAWYYYWMYALERACILYDPEMKKLGGHDWYHEGAADLLDVQQADGSWTWSTSQVQASPDSDVWNTCFAILFLRRSTRPLVATGGTIDR